MINHGSLIHQVSSCIYSSARPLTVMLGGLGASTTVLQAFSRSACLSSPARPLTAMLGDLGRLYDGSSSLQHVDVPQQPCQAPRSHARGNGHLYDGLTASSRSACLCGPAKSLASYARRLGRPHTNPMGISGGRQDPIAIVHPSHVMLGGLRDGDASLMAKRCVTF